MVHDPHGHVEALRIEARDTLAAGADPLSREDRIRGRFLLTDLADDLAETSRTTNRHEQLALADRVLREAVALLTAYHRAWNGAGKWLPRRLLEADPTLGQDLLSGHLKLAEHADPALLITSVYSVLDLLGGPLREGFTEPPA